jgi:hypothetical protein
VAGGGRPLLAPGHQDLNGWEQVAGALGEGVAHLDWDVRDDLAAGATECQRRPDAPSPPHELTRPLAALVGFATSRQEVVAQVVEFWLEAMFLPPDTRA